MRAAIPPALFPPDVAQHGLWFDPAAEPLDPVSLPPELTSAVARRQREFVAGRACARAALQALGDARGEVGVGPQREPRWPQGFVGAITHADGYAAAAVARAGDYRGLGLDSELRISAESAPAVAAVVTTPGELDQLERTGELPRELLLTLVFSAKEVIFKCLFPTVRRYFDFSDARIDAIDARTLTFRASLLTTLAPSLAAGLPLAGRFAVSGDRVHTALTLR